VLDVTAWNCAFPSLYGNLHHIQYYAAVVSLPLASLPPAFTPGLQQRKRIIQLLPRPSSFKLQGLPGELGQILDT
jgi:hypothetical protein